MRVKGQAAIVSGGASGRRAGDCKDLSETGVRSDP